MCVFLAPFSNTLFPTDISGIWVVMWSKSVKHPCRPSLITILILASSLCFAAVLGVCSVPPQHPAQCLDLVLSVQTVPQMMPHRSKWRGDAAWQRSQHRNRTVNHHEWWVLPELSRNYVKCHRFNVMKKRNVDSNTSSHWAVTCSFLTLCSFCSSDTGLFTAEIQILLSDYHREAVWQWKQFCSADRRFHKGQKRKLIRFEFNSTTFDLFKSPLANALVYFLGLCITNSGRETPGP